MTPFALQSLYYGRLARQYRRRIDAVKHPKKGYAQTEKGKYLRVLGAAYDRALDLRDGRASPDERSIDAPR